MKGNDLVKLSIPRECFFKESDAAYGFQFRRANWVMIVNGARNVSQILKIKNMRKNYGN